MPEDDSSRGRRRCCDRNGVGSSAESSRVVDGRVLRDRREPEFGGTTRKINEIQAPRYVLRDRDHAFDGWADHQPNAFVVEQNAPIPRPIAAPVDGRVVAIPRSAASIIATNGAPPERRAPDLSRVRMTAPASAQAPSCGVHRTSCTPSLLPLIANTPSFARPRD